MESKINIAIKPQSSDIILFKKQPLFKRFDLVRDNSKKKCFARNCDKSRSGDTAYCKEHNLYLSIFG